MWNHIQYQQLEINNEKGCYEYQNNAKGCYFSKKNPQNKVK